MRVTVRLFAGHRERAGTGMLVIEVPDGASVGDVFAALEQRYPSLGETASFTTFARNRKVVAPSEVLAHDDEVALLQPVSGGSHEVAVTVTSERLSADECIMLVEDPGCGGVVLFFGVVRDNSEGTATDHLEYEAYPEMAEDVIRLIAGEARQRWPVARVAVQHRTGELRIGEVSVIVAVSAPHRSEAFEACRYMIDELKRRAPIWKKEFGAGGEVWVAGPASGNA